MVDSNSRVYNKFADGLGDENNIFEYTMSPNPTSDFLNIKMADNRNATFSILISWVKKIETGKISENAINVSKLASGVYLLEVNDGQKNITKNSLKSNIFLNSLKGAVHITALFYYNPNALKL
jgi:hypothetical protein